MQYKSFTKLSNRIHKKYELLNKYREAIENHNRHQCFLINFPLLLLLMRRHAHRLKYVYRSAHSIRARCGTVDRSSHLTTSPPALLLRRRGDVVSPSSESYKDSGEFLCCNVTPGCMHSLAFCSQTT